MTKESHVAPHFDHLDLRNAMMSLVMPLALREADVGAVVIS